MERIKQYYRLSSLKSINELPTPLYNQIEEKKLEVIFTKKHVNMFLKKDKTAYTLRETVIGGKQKKIISHNNKNIIVF